MARYYYNMQEPYFSFLKAGKKTIEGRLKKGKYSSIAVEDTIIVQNQDGPGEVNVEVVGLRSYPSFLDMLTKENYSKALPDVTSPQEGSDIYRRFYTEDDEYRYGVIAIEVRLVA